MKKYTFAILALLLISLFLSVSAFSQTAEPDRFPRWDRFLDYLKNGQMTMTYKTLSSPTITSPTVSGTATSTATWTFSGTVNVDTTMTVDVLNYAGTSTSAAGTDSFAVTLAPAADDYKAGMIVIFKPDTVNTGACVLNVNSLGWKAIKTVSGADPADNDFVTTGLAICLYDGTDFHLLNPATTTD